METETLPKAASPQKRRLGWLKILGIVLVTVLLSVVATLWILKTYVFPSEFEPVTLSAQEEQRLDGKLKRITPVTNNQDNRRSLSQGGTTAATNGDETLQPEPYSEEGASRTIHLTEREVNALLAKNTNLAQRVAIDLADDLLSAKILVPMDEDFPILGGKTVRAKAGLEIAFENDRPIVKLRGVSVMGVPIPNAWLGKLKNIDLVKEYGNEPGFWKAFAAGIESVKVEEGQLTIELKE
ncbi:MAG TPA: arginine N-succinyltransferase [Chromatiales bacterium]|nr:arginine N-succinyltransferase [Chromatiales bacterium]